MTLPDGPESQDDVYFIPMDKEGNAMTGSTSAGMCQGPCFTGRNGLFVGPVFHITTPGAMKYDFTIFNNAGEFVARGNGSFTDADLQKAQRSNGSKYIVRVVWTGHAVNHSKAGTGAYILQAVLTSEKDSRSGAAAATTIKRIRFGLLRNSRGS